MYQSCMMVVVMRILFLRLKDLYPYQFPYQLFDSDDFDLVMMIFALMDFEERQQTKVIL